MSERELGFIKWFIEIGPENRAAVMNEIQDHFHFPRENADTKGHGSGEQEAQAPIGPRPSQETEPLGGAWMIAGVPWWGALILALLIGELLAKVTVQWTKAVFGL